MHNITVDTHVIIIASTFNPTLFGSIAINNFLKIVVMYRCDIYSKVELFIKIGEILICSNILYSIIIKTIVAIIPGNILYIYKKYMAIVKGIITFIENELQIFSKENLFIAIYAPSKIYGL